MLSKSCKCDNQGNMLILFSKWFFLPYVKKEKSAGWYIENNISNVIKNLKASPLLTPGINASMYAAVWHTTCVLSQ